VTKTNRKYIFLEEENYYYISLLSVDISYPHPIKTLLHSFHTPISEKRVNKPNTYKKKKEVNDGMES